MIGDLGGTSIEGEEVWGEVDKVFDGFESREVEEGGVEDICEGDGGLGPRRECVGEDEFGSNVDEVGRGPKIDVGKMGKAVWS